MTVETDTLADAATRFSEAIRAERTSTVDTLSAERRAALQIIQALREERGRKAREASGRLVLAVALGVAAGVAVVYFVSQRASEESRLGLRASGGDGDDGPSLADRFRRAVDAGKRAASGREQELWQRYRTRLSGEGAGDGAPGRDRYPL